MVSPHTRALSNEESRGRARVQRQPSIHGVVLSSPTRKVITLPSAVSKIIWRFPGCFGL